LPLGSNPDLKKKYQAALVTNDCWQATPGKVIDLVRHLGVNAGGIVEEDSTVTAVSRNGNTYTVLVQKHRGEYVEYEILSSSMPWRKRKKSLHAASVSLPVHTEYVIRRSSLAGYL
jgi:hypothetical protein